MACYDLGIYRTEAAFRKSAKGDTGTGVVRVHARLIHARMSQYVAKIQMALSLNSLREEEICARPDQTSP
jgi:hypothetical protein